MALRTYLLVFVAILAILIQWGGIMKENHTLLIANPNGEQLAPNFRGLPGENFFKNTANLWIHYRQWLPYPTEKESELGKSVRGVVFLQHSMMHHAEMFDELANELTKENIAVYAIDFTGFGFSEGDRMYTTIPDEVSNLRQFMDLKQPIHGKEKVFLLGISAGGAISAGIAQHFPQRVKGLVVMSSILGAQAESLPSWALSIMEFISKYFPKLPVLPPLSMSDATRNETLAKQLQQDPVINRCCIRAKFANAAMKFLIELRSQLPNMNVPALFLCGTGDKLSPPELTELPYKEIGSQDKTLKLYPEGRHHLFDELNKQEVLNDVKKWIVDRL